MLENKLNVEKLISQCEINWNQPNDGAGPTTVRLIRAGDIMLAISRRRFEQFNLTAAEFDTLSTLRKIGAPYELNPANICKSNLLSSGGLTKALNNLENRGLVERLSNSKDKRSRIVRLSEDGLTLINQAMEVLLENNERLFASIYSEEERRQLNVLLQKFHQAFE